MTSRAIPSTGRRAAAGRRTPEQRHDDDAPRDGCSRRPGARPGARLRVGRGVQVSATTAAAAVRARRLGRRRPRHVSAETRRARRTLTIETYVERYLDDYR